MDTTHDQGWTLVPSRRKPKNNNKKPKNNQPKNKKKPNHQRPKYPKPHIEPPKLIAPGIIERRITKQDTELTDAEWQLLQADTKLGCYCCEEDRVSTILRRPFASCGRCYCCAGDDPSFDDDEWFDQCVVRYFCVRIDDQGNELGNAQDSYDLPEEEEQEERTPNDITQIV